MNNNDDKMNAFLKMFEDAGIQAVEVNPNNPKDLEALSKRIKSEVEIIKNEKSNKES